MPFSPDPATRFGNPKMATRPLLIDLFCCAGGAGTGFHRAGFDIVGVDIKPQPNYPFEFVQADALQFLDDLLSTDGWYGGGDTPARTVAAVHASPPCQASSSGRHMPNTREHADLIAATRDRLRALGLPYVIENVEGAALLNPIRLCGSSFGLRADGHDLNRHRLFESNVPMMALSCAHSGDPVLGIYGDRAKTSRGKTLSERSSVWSRPESLAVGSAAMGIDWMTWRELREAIPPVFTEFVGGYLMTAITRGALAHAA